MSVTQTVDIPASRRLTIEVPGEVPTGRVFLTFSAAPPANSSRTPPPRTAAEALEMAIERSADPNREPISRHFGTLSPTTYGDGVEYQRAIRDEWD